MTKTDTFCHAEIDLEISYSSNNVENIFQPKRKELMWALPSITKTTLWLQPLPSEKSNE